MRPHDSVGWAALVLRPLGPPSRRPEGLPEQPNRRLIQLGPRHHLLPTLRRSLAQRPEVAFVGGRRGRPGLDLDSGGPAATTTRDTCSSSVRWLRRVGRLGWKGPARSVTSSRRAVWPAASAGRDVGAGQRVGKRRRRAGDPALRGRAEPEDLDPAGERVGERRDEQDVRRAGEQEPARAAVPVDGELEGRERAGSALHLVERRACRKLGHEPRRVGLRGGVRGFIVLGEVGVAGHAADAVRYATTPPTSARRSAGRASRSASSSSSSPPSTAPHSVPCSTKREGSWNSHAAGASPHVSRRSSRGRVKSSPRKALRRGRPEAGPQPRTTPNGSSDLGS